MTGPQKATACVENRVYGASPVGAVLLNPTPEQLVMSRPEPHR